MGIIMLLLKRMERGMGGGGGDGEICDFVMG